jgi:hypothetical protein
MSSIAKLSASLRSALSATSSARAIETASPVDYRKANDLTVSKKLGKQRSFGRRLIRYERLGPFHRQTGDRSIGGTILPMMQTYFLHRFLHATKGWREYLGGATLRVPMSPSMKQYPAAFFGRNHKFA